MTLFFVSGAGWSGWLREYMIAGMLSWVLEYKRYGDKSRQVGVFMNSDDLEQFMDELEDTRQFPFVADDPEKEVALEYAYRGSSGE